MHYNVVTLAALYQCIVYSIEMDLYNGATPRELIIAQSNIYFHNRTFYYIELNTYNTIREPLHFPQIPMKAQRQYLQLS